MDHIYYVAAGMRNDPARKFTACRDDEARKILNERGGTPHRVRFDHGGVLDTVIAIDEQFYFEDAEDARWFYREGYKQMLYDGEERPDRMSLFIDGQDESVREGA
jgi:hypothetical protein